jgi:peptide/nickel transport system substrate-binding protein
MIRRLRNLLPGVMIIILAISLLTLAACANGKSATSPQTAPASPAATAPSSPAPVSEPKTDIQQLSSYTIADSTGDWGYPTPYAHYSRGPGYTRMQFIFETLVWKNDTEFVPQLAREWKYNASDRSYIFTLQQNVKWHDGADFTAEDVVFTYNYTKDHPYQWVDNSIVKSVEALDKYTVKLYLSRPYAPFFQDVAGTQPILPKHIWQNITGPDKFMSPEAVIGTGPYKLADYSKEHGTYLYRANDSYYLGKPAARELKFVKISAEMTPAALKGGSVNAVSIPAEVVNDFKAAGFMVIIDQPSWNGKLTINHQKEPLSSKEFRQAIAYAIDREALVQIVFRGHAVAGSPGMMPPTSVWFNSDTPQYKYDLAKAKQLIAGLGYNLDNGYFFKNGQPLKLSLIAAADYKDLGQFVAQQLEKAGIKIDFQTLEAKTVDAKVGAWDFDLSIYGHGGLYEPSIYYKVVLDKGFNSARYTSNNVLNQLINDQLTEMDAKKRKELVFRIQEVYAGDVPALTLYYPKSYMAHDMNLSLYYTMDGIASGVPIALNRMCFVK